MMVMVKLKFIIDESVDFSVVNYFRNKGYNTTAIAEDFPSLDDTEILKIAFKENRILVANDKDFGTLVFKMNLKSHGIILFRLKDQSSKSKIKAIDLIINNYYGKLLDNFIVVSERKVRIRKI